MFRQFIYFILLFSYSLGWCQSENDLDSIGEPFIYTEWQSFTTESTEGHLINDHIFFLEADGDSLWIGTEGGLILFYDGKWESWNEDDGLPWNVVMGIAKDPRTGELWLA